MTSLADAFIPSIECYFSVCKNMNLKIKESSSASKVSLDRTNFSDAEAFTQFFLDFAEDNKRILNKLIQNKPALMASSFDVLIQAPRILDFDNKRNFFYDRLHKNRGRYGRLELQINRRYILQESYIQINRLTGEEFKDSPLNVRFRGEEGVDAGGVRREWYQVLCKQMFNPDFLLFVPSSAEKVTVQPSRLSHMQSDHLGYFKFAGRVIGKAVNDRQLLDVYFTRSFYKHILGKKVDYKDMEAVDLEFYNSLKWMLENDITDVLDYTFSVESEDFGKRKVIDLKDNGSSISVTNENKEEYVRLMAEHKLTDAFKDQITAFLSGFHEIVPPKLVSIFDEAELELLISGVPDIDIDDMQNNTDYHGYTATSPQIGWFWRALRSFDKEERAKLVQFVTGTSKVPLEGFKALQGMHGIQRFQIHKMYGRPDRLPSAHTWYVTFARIVRMIMLIPA